MVSTPLKKMLILQKLFKRRSRMNSEASKSGDSERQEGIPVIDVASTLLREQLIGLQVLHEPNTTTNIVSIVFVHGLGGSARETWTHHPSKVFWPTLLHEDDRFVNVQISTFGYDANFKNIFDVKNVLGIQDFSKQLLDCLDLHYDKYNDVSIADCSQLISDSHNIRGA
jgi:hypothetical protein